MKYIFLIFISLNSFAAFISETDIVKCQNGEVVSIFAEEKVCTDITSNECHEITPEMDCRFTELTEEDGKKVLKTNEAKLAAHLAKLKAEEDAKKLEEDKKQAAKEKLKTFDKSKITTVKAAAEMIAELVEILK